MKIVQHDLLDTGSARHFTYYTVSTGLDINPANGKEAKLLFQHIRNVVGLGAVIEDDITIRVYENDDIFKLGKYSSSGKNIEVVQYMFSVTSNNNSWDVTSLQKALQDSLVPSTLMGPIGHYSINWFKSANPSLALYVREQSPLKLTLIPNSQLHISSTIPASDAGRLNDYWFVIKNSLIRFYIKTQSGWQDVSSDIVFASTEPAQKPLVWIKDISGLKLQKSNGSSWNTASLSIQYSDTIPTDTSKLWLRRDTPTGNFSVWEYNTTRLVWEQAKISANQVRDVDNWFSVSSTFILEDNNALFGVVADNNTNIGGDVEIYKTNTDVSNLIGKVTKLVFKAGDQLPYIDPTNSDTVIIGPISGETVMTKTESIVISDITAINNENIILNITRNTAGAVTNLETDASSVRVHMVWDKAVGDITGVPTIGTTNATPTSVGATAGYVDILVSAGTVTATYHTASASMVIAAVIAKPAITATWNSVYPVGQTTVKQNDNVTLNIVSTEAVDTIEVQQLGLGLAEIRNVTASTNHTVVLPCQVTELVDTSKTFSIRAKTPAGSWSPWITSNALIANNATPTIANTTITYPVGQTALKGVESVTINTTVTNSANVTVVPIAGLINPGFVNLLNGQVSVVCTRNGGGYDITTDKVSIIATASNGRVATEDVNIHIADTAPALSAVFASGSIQRAGSNNNVLTITSSQPILAGLPTATGLTFVRVNNTTFTTSFNVALNASGTVNLPQISLSNDALVVANITPSYTVSGFAPIRVTFNAFTQQASIGKAVTNTAKLNVVDAAGFVFTFVNNKTTNAGGFTYTIVDSTGNISATGNHIYINDTTWTSNNTTGTRWIEIEEIL